MTALLAIAALTGTCVAVDGDTLRCTISGDARPLAVRLTGIDAPELPGHCRRGRVCVAGDPVAATQSLARAVAQQKVVILPVARDRYGRTVARAATASGDLSCHQLRARVAAYVPKWDNGRAIARTCPEAAQ